MKISASSIDIRNIIPNVLSVIFEFPFLMIKPIKTDTKYQQSNHPERDLQVPAVA